MTTPLNEVDSEILDQIRADFPDIDIAFQTHGEGDNTETLSEAIDVVHYAIRRRQLGDIHDANSNLEAFLALLDLRRLNQQKMPGLSPPPTWVPLTEATVLSSVIVVAGALGPLE